MDITEAFESISDTIRSLGDSLGSLVRQNPVTSIGSFFASIPPIFDTALGAVIEVAVPNYQPEIVGNPGAIDVIMWSKFGVWLIFMFFVISRVVYKMLKDRQEVIKAEMENDYTSEILALRHLIDYNEQERAQYVIDNPTQSTKGLDDNLKRLKKKLNKINETFLKK